MKVHSKAAKASPFASKRVADGCPELRARLGKAVHSNEAFHDAVNRTYREVRFLCENLPGCSRAPCGPAIREGGFSSVSHNTLCIYIVEVYEMQ